MKKLTKKQREEEFNLAVAQFVHLRELLWDDILDRLVDRLGESYEDVEAEFGDRT